MMTDVSYEWDAEKAARNLALHGVSFENAISVFGDPYAIEEYDWDSSALAGEDRYQIIGRMYDQILVLTVFTPREDKTRIISARKAEGKEIDKYADNFIKGTGATDTRADIRKRHAR